MLESRSRGWRRLFLLLYLITDYQFINLADVLWHSVGLTAGMTATLLSTPTTIDVPALLARLGYAPAPAGGTRLRGCHNPDGSLRWVWPTTLRQPLFLEFYNAASPKARLFSALVRLVFACRLQGLFFKKLPGQFVATGEQAWPGSDFALFTGTPGPNRKAVCCYEAAPGQRVFAKLPLGAAATEKVAAEARHLNDLTECGFTSFTFPRILGYEPSYLLQSSVKPTGAQRAAHFGAAHARCLTELLDTTAVRQPLVASACWQTIGEQVTALEALPETPIPFGLRRKLRHLRAVIDPLHQLTFAFAHGDFTPWNCWLGTEGLAIYDLELAQPEASLLYDLFHFETQQALLVTRQPAAGIRERALAVAGEFFPTVPIAEVALAWQLYLLHQVSTGALLYHAQPDWHPQISWLLNGWNTLLTRELAITVEHRQLAIYDLLDYVQLLPQPGVVLKPRAENSYYPAPTSDLDLLLTRPDTLAGVQFMQRFPLVQSAKVRQAAHMVSVDCLFQDGSLLSVDLLHQLHRKTLQLLDAPAVLAQAERAAGGVPVPALLHDFAYTWLFYWLNQSDLPLTHLRHFQRQCPERQAAMVAHLKETYGLTFSNLACASVYQPAKAALLHLALRQQPANGRVARKRRGLRYLLSTAADFVRPGGLIITFSGVDGAGKSTVIEHVKERLEKKWRKRVVVIRHRPSVLPILSAWQYGKKGAEARSVQNLPRQGQNFSLSSSLVRFGYYYLDYIVGQVVIWLKHTRRGHVVLYDRYYFDFINDGRRSNINLPARFTQALYAFVNKPKLNFFLYADPQEILRRKQELSASTITQLTQQYKSLFGALGARYRRSRYVPIENQDLDTTLNLIGRYIQQEM
jgi:thymidylate kinase